MNRLRTERLELVQLDHACIEAWIARDANKLEELTGARFPEPVDAPPLFDADLPRILDTLADGRTAGPWLFVLSDTREPVAADMDAKKRDFILRTAERAGLKRVGKDFDPDVGPVGIFELSR